MVAMKVLTPNLVNITVVVYPFGKNCHKIIAKRCQRFVNSLLCWANSILKFWRWLPSVKSNFSFFGVFSYKNHFGGSGSNTLKAVVRVSWRRRHKARWNTMMTEPVVSWYFTILDPSTVFSITTYKLHKFNVCHFTVFASYSFTWSVDMFLDRSINQANLVVNSMEYQYHVCI